MTLCPLAANAGGREPHTSPRPPVFDQGATCSHTEQSARKCFAQQSSQVQHPEQPGYAVHHEGLNIALDAMQQPSALLASAVTKTILYVALMVSLSPCTCVLSALEASAADGGLSASRVSAGYVATPSEALEFRGLDVLRFLLNVCLQPRARGTCNKVSFLA